MAKSLHVCVVRIMGVTHAQKSDSFLYQKYDASSCKFLVPDSFAIVQFGRLCFENFWYQKLAPNRAAFYSVQPSGASFLNQILERVTLL